MAKKVEDDLSSSAGYIRGFVQEMVRNELKISYEGIKSGHKARKGQT